MIHLTKIYIPKLRNYPSLLLVNIFLYFNFCYRDNVKFFVGIFIVIEGGIQIVQIKKILFLEEISIIHYRLKKMLTSLTI